MSLINKKRFSGTSLQRGFTLIEILVTVIVLTIGLLGLAGLQATALRFNSTAYQRSQATILASDLIERIRANPDQTHMDYVVCTMGGTCGGTAQQDIQGWNAMIAQLLPSGNGVVRVQGATCVVQITWDDSRGQEAPRVFAIRTNL